MKELTVLTPTGCIGNRGLHEQAFVAALDQERPSVIAVDGGSFDIGPWYLGTGRAHSPISNIRRDLDIILTEGVGKRRIPFIIGSSGGSGARPHVDLTLQLVQEIAKNRNLDFNVGVIYSDVSQQELVDRIGTGKNDIRKVPADILGEPLTQDLARRSSRTVAMMGPEPIIKALKDGADVVLAGRASDACAIGAYPIMEGFDKGLALHMGDIMECGEAALTDIEGVTRILGPNRVPVIGVIGDTSFTLKAGHRGMACTVESASAHSLYERENHSQVELPGGILNKTGSRFQQATQGTVLVSGTRFVPKPYSVLLEGVERIGFRTISVLGARNPIMIRQIDDILEAEKTSAEDRFKNHGEFAIHYHVYGTGAVLGTWEPTQRPDPMEVGIVIDVVAENQELAHDIVEDLALKIAFSRYPGRTTTAGNVGYLFSPNVIDAGEAFVTTIYHQMPVDDPLEPFDISVRNIRES